MKIVDVILHHPNWKIHCGDCSEERLSQQSEVRRLKDDFGVDLWIEAIPEKIDTISYTGRERG